MELGPTILSTPAMLVAPTLRVGLFRRVHDGLQVFAGEVDFTL